MFCTFEQAIEELNIKQNYWKDLLTDDAFTRKDIIHLQDPLNLAVSPMHFLIHPETSNQVCCSNSELPYKMPTIGSCITFLL